MNSVALEIPFLRLRLFFVVMASSRNANALAGARALRVAKDLDYCGLRDAAAEDVPATSTAVPLLECSASTEPKPFAVADPLLVAAFAPPAPVRFTD